MGIKKKLVSGILVLLLTAGIGGFALNPALASGLVEAVVCYIPSVC